MTYDASNPERQKSEYILGTEILADLGSMMPNSSEHKVFLDNLYSSYTLLQSHSPRKKIFFISIVKENRLSICPL